MHAAVPLTQSGVICDVCLHASYRLKMIKYMEVLYTSVSEPTDSYCLPFIKLKVL